MIIAFLIGLVVGAGSTYLWLHTEQKRAEREYQQYLSRCCKFCGAELDDSGKACSCWADSGWLDDEFFRSSVPVFEEKAQH